MDLELMLNSLPKLLFATLITLKLLASSLTAGLVLALVFSIMRISKNNFLFYFSYIFSNIFRGIPLLVQIFIIYYGFGQIEYLRSTIFWVIFKEPFGCAMFALSLNTAAYTSEILRSAFETVKVGYVEAGQSLGLSKKKIFYKIRLPLAIHQSLSAYGNEIILLMKGTALASTVTLMDITGVARNIISTSFKPIEVFIVAGSIYLCLTFLIQYLIKTAENKFKINV
jgi:octopine/nopaline transport system permease protein